MKNFTHFLLILLGFFCSVAMWADNDPITYNIVQNSRLNRTDGVFRNTADVDIASAEWGGGWRSKDSKFILRVYPTSNANFADNSSGARFYKNTTHVTLTSSYTGYVIKSVAITFKDADVKVAYNGTDASSRYTHTTTSDSKTVTLYPYTTSLTFYPELKSGDTKQDIYITSMVVTLINNTPSLSTSGKSLVRSGSTSSITVATSESDNSHWYLLTQRRNQNIEGQSVAEATPIRPSSGSLKRASGDYTLSYFDNLGLSDDDKQYLVRFIKADSRADNYYIQFASGQYVKYPSSIGEGGVLRVGDTPDMFKLYNITGSLFGWNITTTGTDYANMVDNQGRGNNVVLYDTGQNTSESENSNNVWKIYPVTINDIPIVASDDPSTGQKYLMRLYNRYCGKGTGDNEGKQTSSTYVAADNNYIWSFKGTYNGGYKIYNVGLQKYVKVSDASGSTVSFVDEEDAATFNMVMSSAGDVGFRLSGTTDCYLNDYQNANNFSTWKSSEASATSDGCKFLFTPVYTVNFSSPLTINGKTVSEINIKSGETITLPDKGTYTYGGVTYQKGSEHPLSELEALLNTISSNMDITDTFDNKVNYTNKTLAGVVLGSGLQNITGDYFEPIAYAGYTVNRVTDDDDSDAEVTYGSEEIIGTRNFTVYYSLTSNPVTASTIGSPDWQTVKQDGKFVYYDASDAKVKYSASLDGDVYQRYLWIFVGDEANGYALYNRQSEKYLVKGDAVGASRPGDYLLTMSSAADTKWVVNYVNSQNQLYDLSDSQYLSSETVSSALCPVTDATPVGYTVIGSPVTELEKYYTFTRLEKTQGFVGGFTAAQITAGKAAVSDTQPTTLAEYETFLAALGNKIALEDGGFYRIRNAFSGFYENQSEYKELYYSSSDAIKWKSADANNPTFIFRLTKHGDCWYIENMNVEKYLTSNAGGTLSTTAQDYTLTTEAANPAIFYLNDGSNNMHAGGHNNGAGVSGSIIRYDSGSASQWYIIPVSNITSINLIEPTQESVETVYQSYAQDDKAVIVNNTDVTLSVVTGVEDSKAVMTAVDNKVIKGDAGVILSGPRGKTVYLMTVSTTEDDNYEDNLLERGDGTAKTDDYVLAYKADDTQAFFYKIGTLAIPTNRAYLPASVSSVKALSLSFDDEGVTTAVESVSTEREVPTSVYDLQGRRVQKADKGLYIVGGRKVIVK